jgi:hypothetical protein
MFRFIITSTVSLALMLSIGCSKPPEVERATSEAALQSAVEAGAGQYAPEAYQMASDTLNAAMEIQKEQDSKISLLRDYDKPKQMYDTARQLAEKAKSDALSEKERVRLDVEEMMTRMQAAIDAASHSLLIAPVGKGARADVEVLKNDLASVVAAFEEVKIDVNEGRHQVAQSKLSTLIPRAQAIVDQVNAAKNKKKGM